MTCDTSTNELLDSDTHFDVGWYRLHHRRLTNLKSKAPLSSRPGSPFDWHKMRDDKKHLITSKSSRKDTKGQNVSRLLHEDTEGFYLRPLCKCKAQQN